MKVPGLSGLQGRAVSTCRYGQRSGCCWWGWRPSMLFSPRQLSLRRAFLCLFSDIFPEALLSGRYLMLPDPCNCSLLLFSFLLPLLKGFVVCPLCFLHCYVYEFCDFSRNCFCCFVLSPPPPPPPWSLWGRNALSRSSKIEKTRGIITEEWSQPRMEGGPPDFACRSGLWVELPLCDDNPKPAVRGGRGRWKPRKWSKWTPSFRC